MKREPVYSMTGYSRIAGEIAEGGWTLTLKSVNHRFLDLQFRLPGGMDALEVELRSRLKQSIRRGHVDVTLTIERQAASGGIACDRDLVAQYLRLYGEIQREHGLKQEPDLNAILQMPGVFGSTGSAAYRKEGQDAVSSAFRASVLERLDEATTALNTMRVQEGSALADTLRESLEQLELGVRQAADLRLGIQQALYERLAERMRSMLPSELHNERLLQEAALFADKSDVEEETARLLVHMNHFRGLLDGGGEVGKKLDFLLQEMNREANTLLSKSAGLPGDGARITEIGLELKSGIEKLREQVQNLE